MKPAARESRSYPSERATSRRATAPSVIWSHRYRALVEQIPAVVFMAYLDRGIGEAYVSPQIEASLGFSQAEWLEDPVRWYQHIHPDDKQRWSIEAAQMFLSGTPLRSAYRVMARDGRVVWFHCEAKMIRRADGEPWFIHGVGFDITELKRTEEALQEERNVVSAILHTVGALVVVLDQRDGSFASTAPASRPAGYSFDEVEGKIFLGPMRDAGRGRAFQDYSSSNCAWISNAKDYESYLGHARWRAATDRVVQHGSAGQRWSARLYHRDGNRHHGAQAAGESDSGNQRREQRRIGQDLHDGLGQHLTGIAFMSKVQEQKLAEKRLTEAGEAAKIVKLVNEAINKTRELAHGLLPVVADRTGLDVGAAAVGG